ncbi:hypothetical protein, partial [Claveliimonas sp.]|uniref:hypothetical protein n=1 Tax=Claveliimonas sp. TaxID=3076672 RepID=UPI00307C3049
LEIFRVVVYCSVIKVLSACFAHQRQLLQFIMSLDVCQQLFSFFLFPYSPESERRRDEMKLFCAVSRDSFDIISLLFFKVNLFFYFSFTFLFFFISSARSLQSKEFRKRNSRAERGRFNGRFLLNNTNLRPLS